MSMRPRSEWISWPWIAISALLAMIGAGASDATIWLHYVFKPLTTALIFVAAWFTPIPVGARYRRAVLTGIGLSLCGDIFLMLPRSLISIGFVLGLATFLVAHLFFLRALSTDARLFGKPLIFLLLGTFGAINLMFLWPGIGAGLKLPVVVYVACLLAMSSQALTRYFCIGSAGSRLAAMGGLFFVASDLLLAYNKFYTPIPVSAFWILGTYYPALWLIAQSVASNNDTQIKK